MRLNPTKLCLGVLAPLITALSAWLAASVAKYGVHVDPSGVNAALVSGATCGIAVMVKLIHDVEEDPKVKAVSADAEIVAKAVEQADPLIHQAVQRAIETEVLNLSHRIDQAPAISDSGDTHALPAKDTLALDARHAVQESSAELETASLEQQLLPGPRAAAEQEALTHRLAAAAQDSSTAQDAFAQETSSEQDSSTDQEALTHQQAATEQEALAERDELIEQEASSELAPDEQQPPPEQPAPEASSTLRHQATRVRVPPLG
jgi:hypothetical protein